MDFFETSEALNNEDILQSENELVVNFPKEFIAHYLKHNGGRSEYDKYVWRDGGTTRINSFFPIKYYSFGNIETTYKDLVILENYLPKGIVPFATDDGGNFFCISTRNNDFGYIFYCNNDDYDINNLEKVLKFIENSFDEFLNRLR